MPPKIPPTLLDRVYAHLSTQKINNFPVSVDEFAKRMKSDPVVAKNTYSLLSSQNIKNLPDTQEEFMQKLGLVEKKNPGESVSLDGYGQPQIGSKNKAGASDEQVARLETTYGKSPAPFVTGAINQADKSLASESDLANVKANVTGDNGVNIFNSIAGTFDRSFVKTLITGVPKSVAVGVNWATGGNVENDVLYKSAKWVEDLTDQFAPVNPKHSNEEMVKIAEAAGTIGAYIMGGGLGRTSRVADLAVPTAKKAVMESMAQHLPGTFLASANTAASEYENALHKTGSQNIAKEAWFKGLLSGVPFLLSPTLTYFNKYTGGKVTTALVEGAKGGIDGMFQMGTSAAITNMGAKETYDFTRNLMDGVLEAGGSGFAINGLMNGIIAAVTHSPTLTHHDKFEIINSVKEKQKMLSDNNIRDTDYFKTHDGKPTEPVEMVEKDGVWVVKGSQNAEGKAGENVKQQGHGQEEKGREKNVLGAPREMGEYSPQPEEKPGPASPAAEIKTQESETTLPGPKVVADFIAGKPIQNEGQSVPGETQRQADITGGEKPGDIKVGEEVPKPTAGAGAADKGLINNTKATQGFFSDVVTGASNKYKPVKPYEAIMKFTPDQNKFNQVYSKFKGNFDEHIATSIPGFRDIQVKKGQAIIDMLPKGGLMIDIAGSEGGLNKAITQISGGKIRTQNLDVNPDMKVAHEASPVPGADYVQNSFLQDYTDNGVTYKKWTPKEKADVVHETMGFQFMSPQRAEQFQEVVDNYLKKDGVFIVEQKVGNKEWDQNEKIKDEQFKSRFYTKEQIEQKNKDVKVSDFDANEGMAGNMVTEDVVLRELGKHFSDVRQYWDSGNFKGYIASNDPAKIDRFMNSIGDTHTEFSNRTSSELIGAKSGGTESGLNIKNDLMRTDWAVITAENKDAQKQSPEENAAQNAKLKAALIDAGYNPVPAVGKYGGNIENSFYVPGLPAEQAAKLAKEYGQESVLTSKGLQYSNGKLVKSTGLEFSNHGLDYTEVGGVKFSSKLEEVKQEPKVTTDQVADQVQNEAPKLPKEGDTVDFLWLGSDKKGVITSVTHDGRFKIRSGNVTYTVNKSDVGLGPDFSDKSEKGIDNGIKKITPKYKKDTGAILPVTINPFLIAKKAWTYFNKGQELLFGRPFRKLEDWEARMTNKGVESRSWAVRSATNMLRNLIGGLPYSQKDLTNKLQYNGNKTFAHIRAKVLASDLYKIVDSDFDALARVHSVLDPEMYAKDPNLSGMNYSKLNSSERALHDAIRYANNYIHEWSHNNGFIDDATYNKYKDKYIARMYEDIDMMPDDMKETFRSGRADFTMYMHRKEGVDLEILRDPVYATAKRLGQILQNQAVFDYAKGIVSAGKIHVSDTPFPGAVQLGKPGQKPFYGDLTGKYVPQYIAEDFKGFFYSNAIMQQFFSAFKYYDRLGVRQFLKKSHTVYNPLVQLGNFTANYSFAFWTGVDPVSYTMNLVKARNQITSKGPMFNDAVKEGLIGADIMAGDLKPIEPPKAPATDAWGKIKEAYNKFSSLASATYSGSDDMAKLSAYITLRNEGYDSKSAAQQVYEGFQNYATVGKSYDFASKTPIVGPVYVKFKADLARIIKNAVTRRPLTAALYLTLLATIKNYLSSESGESEEVKKVREGRSFVPKIYTPLGPISMVWQVPGVGEVNFARFMTPYYTYDKGDANTVLGHVTAWLPYQMDYMPSTTSKDNKIPWPEMPDVLLGTYAQTVLDRDFRGKSIRDPQGNKYRTIATNEEQALNALNYISRSQIPFFKSTQDMISAYRGEGDFYGRERTISQAVLNNIIKVQQFGPEQAKKYLENDIKYKVAKFEEISKDVGQLRRVYADEIMYIENNKIMSEEGKEKARHRALDDFNDRFAKKLEEQVQIVKDLEDPTKLYEKMQ